MEIEVGDWIRSKDGFIGKVQKISYDNMEKSNYYICEKDNVMASNYLENIVKHSKQLIDLVEVGDYVNGRLVLQVDYKNQNVCLLIPFTDTMANTNIMWYGYEDIKTIATKEMMESISYKVTKM